MRTSTIAAVVAMAAAGCGSSARSTAVSGTSTAATEFQVVLVSAGTGYGQLACWDPKAKRVIDDDACLAAADDHPMLQGPDGTTFATTAKAKQIYCEIEGEPEMAVAGFDLADAEATPAILVFPASAKVQLAAYDDGAEYPATDAQRAAAVAALVATTPGLIDTSAAGAGSHDLDGDGTLDTLLLASGVTPGDEPGTAHASLYADFGDGKLVELFRETGTPSGGIRLHATLDLGGDGRTELYVSGYWNGGGREQIVSVGADRKVTAVGSIGCDS